MIVSFMFQVFTLINIHFSSFLFVCLLLLFFSVFFFSQYLICSMTFSFSFDVLIKLNPIQVNIRGGGSSKK